MALREGHARTLGRTVSADELPMRRAIALAASVRTVTSPNPWVGAVLVAADGSTFEGATERPGGRHAEIVAIDAARAAGTTTEGATLYSTLEPCSHHGRAAPRAGEHKLRAESDAVIVGAGTVRADDPALTVRNVTGHDPLRVVLGRAPDGARVHPCVELEGPLADVLDELGRRGVVQAMIEGGATVAGAFHREGLVDRYVLYLAPALVGGDDARPMFGGAGV